MARVMSYSRGDIVKTRIPRRPGRGKRYALVLSANEYNDAHDHGVLAAISTGILSETLQGVYVIANSKALGLDESSLVTPWLWTLEWSDVDRKVGQMSPYEFGQVMERIREVVPL